MQENLVVKKATPLGARVWTSLLVFGFIGQIAWMVENVYFSTYIQKNITAAGWATSATVAASAIGGTRRLMPVAWLGSTMTGRCDSSCSIGTAARSSVLRV